MTTATLTLTERDTSVLQALLEESAAAIRRNDWEGWLDFFTNDLILLPPDAPIVQGRAAASAYLAEFPQVLAFENSIVETRGCENFALLRGAYTMRADVDGSAVDMHGKWLVTAERQENGSFLFGWDMWSLNAPLA